MKRRHPMQIMAAAELVLGKVYAFVTCWNDGGMDLYEQLCLAVVADTERLIRKRGRWRGQPGHDNEYTLADLMDAKSAIGATMATPAATDPDARVVPFTVHLDGWLPDEPKESKPTIADWRGTEGDYRVETVYSFDRDNDEEHAIAVPVAVWLADPRIHVLDWVNPDDVVKPPVRAVPVLGDETAADKRIDDNLRRIFG